MRAILLATIVVLCTPRLAVGAPFVPMDDAQVLERLPIAPLDPSARQLQALRRQLAEQPGNITLATRVAWRYIEQGRIFSDPRYYGYAQAALAPWWELSEPPVPVLILRATIRQHGHDFESALIDLVRALQADPDNGQAWLTRALILQVRGEYADAKSSCLHVLQVSDPLVAATCVTGVGSLSGEATHSYDMLRRALQQANAPSTSVRLWVLTVLAEIAARVGQPQVAEEHFKQALALGLRDEYLLGAYADFLLDQERPQAVIDLLANETRADALLLRLAIAEKRIGSAAVDEHFEALRARFAASRLRGEAVHRREEARFTLQCLRQPRQALELARENWAVQHEPWDARALLESALAAGEPAAAQPVLEFLTQTGLEDVQLARLTRELRERQP
jgi:tetratricopeptide (TPR) repeat protein